MVLNEILTKMSKMIGYAIIRTAPTCSVEDYSHSDSPILLLGFTERGAIRYQFLGANRRILDGCVHTLPLDFTDENWILYEEAFIEDSTNPLNKFKGEKIHRICPITVETIEDCESEYDYDRSYMDNAVELVVASKHHMIVRDEDGKLNIMHLQFSKPEEWALCKEGN